MFSRVMCYVLPFLLTVASACATRKPELQSKSSTLEQELAAPQNVTGSTRIHEKLKQGITPVFAFWDGGYEGLQARFLQNGNIRNALNLSSDKEFEMHLVHMNPKEYNDDFVFELLDRKLYPDLFPAEFFAEEQLSPELKELVKEKVIQARQDLSSALTKLGSESYQEYANRLASALEKVKDAVLMRAYIADKMTKRDLPGPSLFDGDSMQDMEKFKGQNLTKQELYLKAAVPMSDFIRLGLLKIYGGFWIDSTIAVNTDLRFYKSEMQTKAKQLVVYFNPTYRQTAWNRSDNVADISAGETWWISTQAPANNLISAWGSCANNYWVQKKRMRNDDINSGQEDNEIKNHPIFKNSQESRVDLGKIPDHLRNYLWIYFCWSKVSLSDEGLAERSVLALNALTPNGPYGFMSAHLGQPGILEFSTRLFHTKEQNFTGNEFLNSVIAPLLPKDARGYFEWVDSMKIIKIPGALARKFEPLFGKDAPPAQQKSNVFTYIWNKKRAAVQQER